MRKTIITITLCLIALVNSIIFTWSHTRRNGAEWAQINQSKSIARDDNAKINSCIEGGGMPEYYDGKFSDCKKNK